MSARSAHAICLPICVFQRAIRPGAPVPAAAPRTAPPRPRMTLSSVVSPSCAPPAAPATPPRAAPPILAATIGVTKPPCRMISFHDEICSSLIGGAGDGIGFIPARSAASDAADVSSPGGRLPKPTGPVYVVGRIASCGSICTGGRVGMRRPNSSTISDVPRPVRAGALVISGCSAALRRPGPRIPARAPATSLCVGAMPGLSNGMPWPGAPGGTGGCNGAVRTICGGSSYARFD